MIDSQQFHDQAPVLFGFAYLQHFQRIEIIR